jgi:hypothetical protein
VAGWAAAVQIAVSRHFNNAWTPRADLAASANRTHNISPLQYRIRRLGIDRVILIERIYFGTARKGRSSQWLICLLAFVAFDVIITAIAVMLTLTKIYLQNPG